MTVNEGSLLLHCHLESKLLHPLPSRLNCNLPGEPRFQGLVGEKFIVHPLTKHANSQIRLSLDICIVLYVPCCFPVQVFIRPKNSGSLVPPLLAFWNLSILVEVHSPLPNCPVRLAYHLTSHFCRLSFSEVKVF